MPLRIRINNLNRRKRIRKNAIKKITGRILHRFKIKNAIIDLTFVTNRKMGSLNKEYMKKTGPTDVLSFSLDKEKLVGDIYISSDMAFKNAKRFNTTFENELLRYAAHGLLHLVGFGDKTAGEKRKIRRLEDKFLDEF